MARWLAAVTPLGLWLAPLRLLAADFNVTTPGGAFAFTINGQIQIPLSR